jgi:DnaJ-domain-containing protein 1
MNHGKKGPSSWLDLACEAVAKYGRGVYAAWKEGEAEVFPPSAAARTQKKTQPPPLSRRERGWWEVLEVSATASTEEVRRAYRRLMKQNHPDKAAHLSAEAQRTADKMAKLLNEAYEAAIRRK